jgi:pyrroline-5-carboxylate reductase
MQLGVIGLGRMGGNISLRVMRAGHKAIVFDRSSDAVKKLTQEGAEGAGDLKSLVSSMEKPRTIWVMRRPGTLRNRRSKNWARCWNRGTRSSMAATLFTRTTFAGQKRSGPRRSIMWMSVPPAAYGVWNVAIA